MNCIPRYKGYHPTTKIRANVQGQAGQVKHCLRPWRHTVGVILKCLLAIEQKLRKS